MRYPLHGGAWLALACTLVFSSTAQAKVPVALDCHFEVGDLDCRTLGASYFGSLEGAIEQRRGAALSVVLRATDVGSAIEYTARATSGEETLAVHERVPRAVETEIALAKVLALAQRATLPFVPWRSPARADDGALRVETDDPSATPSATDDDPFYVVPALSGEVFQRGIQVVALGAELEGGLSLESTRILAAGELWYRHVALTLPGDDALEGSVTSASGALVIAQTLHEGLSAAVLLDAGRTPQNNLDRYESAGLGVEWVNVPIRRENENVVGARYRVLGVDQGYVTPNAQHEEGSLFVRQSITGFASMHTDLVDVRGDVTATVVTDAPRFWDVRGNLEIALRLAQGLTIETAATLTVRGDALHAPSDSGGLDPIAVLFAGSDFGTLTYGAELSISYAFGNGLLYAQDQRWRR